MSLNDAKIMTTSGITKYAAKVRRTAYRTRRPTDFCAFLRRASLGCGNLVAIAVFTLKLRIKVRADQCNHYKQNHYGTGRTLC